MASKSHVDNTVNERRLRPIYGTYITRRRRSRSTSIVVRTHVELSAYVLGNRRRGYVTALTHFFSLRRSFFRISDWLDNGNNKKALQEADKVLRKQPSNQCARVLKALALLRLGKENECQVIMDKVRSEVPCEDSTLQAMSICYRETHQRKFSESLVSSADVNRQNFGCTAACE